MYVMCLWGFNAASPPPATSVVQFEFVTAIRDLFLTTVGADKLEVGSVQAYMH